MRAIQKVIIAVYGILVVVACIYVPWRFADTREVWFSTLWEPVQFTANIDFIRILLEIVIITVIAFALFTLTLSASQRRRIIQRITQRIFIQKIIIIAYLLAVLTACIYVPWVSNTYSGIPVPLGYSPIWQPVSQGVNPLLSTLPTVDFKRIILEIIAITAIFTIFFVLTLRNKNKQNREINTIEKPSILDKYRRNHMIFFALWWINVFFTLSDFLTIKPSLQFIIMWAIVFILTLTFLIINIVDTIRVFKIIFPTPTRITTTVLMFILLTPFAGLYVNGLIKTYKTSLSITPSTDKGLNDSNDEESNIKPD
jgi:hypothetical protein